MRKLSAPGVGSGSVKGDVHGDIVTEEEYIASLYEIGYQGAPRNDMLSVDYRF